MKKKNLKKKSAAKKVAKKKTSKKTCSFCGSNEVRLKTEPYASGIIDAKTGKEITVDAHFWFCEKCEHSWMSAEESDRIDDLIQKQAWNVLEPSQIVQVREALGFKTKTQAARFLGLNYKAFSKMELGYNESNLSTDLLLRLIVHSAENLAFVKCLHEKNFRFDTKDYELICKNVGEKWAYQKIQEKISSSESAEEQQSEYSSQSKDPAGYLNVYH